ncbi:zinc finger MYM-type containing 5, partial [Chelydra serpentina]
LSNSEIVNRRWLVYSKCKDAVFCFPCKIFNSCNFKIATMGINDWKNLSHILPQHEKAQHHIESMHKLCELSLRLKNQITLDAQNQRMLQSEKQHWRHVLERLLSMVEYQQTILLLQEALRNYSSPKMAIFWALYNCWENLTQ